MCDDLTEKEAEEYLRKQGMTRRQFGAAGLGTALAMMLPSLASADSNEAGGQGAGSESAAAESPQQVRGANVRVKTPDGEADCYFVHPVQGRHAAVIMWPDIFGTRPAFRLMAKHLAQAGYAVLVPNLYYRTVKGDLMPEGETVIEGDLRDKLLAEGRKNAESLSPQTCVSDGRAFVEFLDKQPSVDTGRKVGVMGYCMTGSYAFRMAADLPERVGAGASFHGGGLVTDAPGSPHKLAPEIEAGMLVAIAQNDDERQPEAKTELRKAFDEAGVDAEIEVYEGAMHGWCPPDSSVYDEDQAARAWRRALVLFKRNLA